MSLNENNKTVNDLPIYDDEKRAQNKPLLYVDIERKKNSFEQIITDLRQSTFQFLNKYQEEKEKSFQFYEATKLDFNQKLDYLRSESVILPKIVFISLSGFGGILLGYRRSNFRKILYSGVLTTASTALCFPNQTKIYTNQATQFAKQQTDYIYKTYLWPEAPKKVKETKPLVTKEKSSSIITQGKDQIIKIDKETKTTEDSLKIEGDQGQGKKYKFKIL